MKSKKDGRGEQRVPEYIFSNGMREIKGCLQHQAYESRALPKVTNGHQKGVLDMARICIYFPMACTRSKGAYST